MYPTGLLHISDNGEMSVHKGDRDSIAFCDYCRVRCDPIQGYCNMNMRATCPSEMSVEFSEVKCQSSLVSKKFFLMVFYDVVDPHTFMRD